MSPHRIGEPLEHVPLILLFNMEKPNGKNSLVEARGRCGRALL